MVRRDDGHHAGAGVSLLPLLDQFIAVAGIVCLFVWARPSLRARRLAASLPLPIREDFPLTAILAYFAGAMLLGAGMQSFAPNDDELTSLIVNNGAQMTGVAACVGLASQRLPGGFRAFFRRTPRPDDPVMRRTSTSEVILLSIVAIGVSPLISEVTGWLIRLAMPDYSFDPHPTLKALAQEQLSFGRTVVLWIGAAVVAPFAEELFFRGVLQNFLCNHIRTGAAVLTTSAAFALVHLSQPHALPALFFLSVLLGVVYLRTASLFAPMLIHALFNLKTLVWESIARLS